MAKKLTTEEVANRVSIATDNKIELIGEYVNIRKHALFHCKVCDYKWTTGPKESIVVKPDVPNVPDVKERIQQHSNNMYSTKLVTNI
ncbi:hypothetical protein [Levilactobacillus brevis]|uniref:hypothetical protein n=1 Tax=Levilactobacillus brevis TaxID=1580 RepID=UPI001CDAB3C1|nr:hypothetical protein [Levilactobacillus brevis]